MLRLAFNIHSQHSFYELKGLHKINNNKANGGEKKKKKKKEEEAAHTGMPQSDKLSPLLCCPKLRICVLLLL
jgi:hypothetical protein